MYSTTPPPPAGERRRNGAESAKIIGFRAVPRVRCLYANINLNPFPTALILFS